MSRRVVSGDFSSTIIANVNPWDKLARLDGYERLLEELKTAMDAGVGTSAPFPPGVRAGGRVRDQRAVSMAPDWSVRAIEHVVSAN